MMNLQSEKLLMANLDPFKPGTLLFEQATSGTYYIDLPDGVYEIWVCGGGAGGGYYNRKSTYGGSAAAFKGEIVVKKGQYKIVIGSGGYLSNGTDTSFGDLIICGGGMYDVIWPGAGGILTMKVTPVSFQIKSNGKDGSSESLLGNGYGAGGYGITVASTGGYVKIIYKRLRA